MSDLSPRPNVRPGPQVARCIGDAARAGLLHLTGTVSEAQTVLLGPGLAYRATLTDGTGSLDLLFLGRATVRGIEPGARCAVEGRAALRDGRLVVWNPRFTLLAPDGPQPPGERCGPVKAAEPIGAAPGRVWHRPAGWPGRRDVPV